MKRFITKILDVPKLIRNIWFMLWIILAILVIFKYCFNLWYPVVVKNEAFINICSFIDNNKAVNLTIMGILYFFSLNILCLTNIGKKKYDNWLMLLIVNLSIGLSFTIKNINNIAGNIYEIFMLFLSFSIYNFRKHSFDKNWKNILVPIINYALLNLWQFTILIVRGTNQLDLSKMSSVIYLIIMLDYYIFLIITWIGVSYMGLLSAGWFFSKDITVLKAAKEKELARKTPNKNTIKKIDERIEELEKEGK